MVNQGQLVVGVISLLGSLIFGLISLQFIPNIGQYWVGGGDSLIFYISLTVIFLIIGIIYTVKGAK